MLCNQLFPIQIGPRAGKIELTGASNSPEFFAEALSHLSEIWMPLLGSLRCTARFLGYTASIHYGPSNIKVPTLAESAKHHIVLSVNSTFLYIL